jgi:hypothetical protein
MRSQRPLSQPPWDASVVIKGDDSSLSKQEYLQKTLASLSPNDPLAQATLRRRLLEQGLITDIEVVEAGGAVVRLVPRPPFVSAWSAWMQRICVCQSLPLSRL